MVLCYSCAISIRSAKWPLWFNLISFPRLKRKKANVLKISFSREKWLSNRYIAVWNGKFIPFTLILLIQMSIFHSLSKTDVGVKKNMGLELKVFVSRTRKAKEERVHSKNTRTPPSPYKIGIHFGQTWGNFRRNGVHTCIINYIHVIPHFHNFFSAWNKAWFKITKK